MGNEEDIDKNSPQKPRQTDPDASIIFQDEKLLCHQKVELMYEILRMATTEEKL